MSGDFFIEKIYKLLILLVFFDQPICRKRNVLIMIILLKIVLVSL